MNSAKNGRMRWIHYCNKRLEAGKNALGVEAAHHQHAIAMQQRGYEILDAQRITELARMKKSPEELQCIRHSLRTTEAGGRPNARTHTPGYD